MKYNLLNVAAFRELSKVIRYLHDVANDYEHFSSKSIGIIVNMAIIALNDTANVLFSDGEVVGAGTYACRMSMKNGITYSGLCDFIHVVRDIRIRIFSDNYDLLQD